MSCSRTSGSTQVGQAGDELADIESSFVSDGTPGDFVVRLLILEAVGAVLSALLLSSGVRAQSSGGARF